MNKKLLSLYGLKWSRAASNSSPSPTGCSRLVVPKKTIHQPEWMAHFWPTPSRRCRRRRSAILIGSLTSGTLASALHLNGRAPPPANPDGARLGGQAHLRIDGMMAPLLEAALSGQVPTPVGGAPLCGATGLTANARAQAIIVVASMRPRLP